MANGIKNKGCLYEKKYFFNIIYIIVIIITSMFNKSRCKKAFKKKFDKYGRV